MCVCVCVCVRDGVRACMHALFAIFWHTFGFQYQQEILTEHEACMIDVVNITNSLPHA